VRKWNETCIDGSINPYEAVTFETKDGRVDFIYHTTSAVNGSSINHASLRRFRKLKFKELLNILNQHRLNIPRIKIQITCLFLLQLKMLPHVLHKWELHQWHQHVLLHREQ
jgi:hypothetical protein